MRCQPNQRLTQARALTERCCCLQDYVRARDAFQRCVELCPDFTKAWVSWAQLEKRVRLGDGVDHVERCRCVLQRGLTLNPKNASLCQVGCLCCLTSICTLIAAWLFLSSHFRQLRGMPAPESSLWRCCGVVRRGVHFNFLSIWPRLLPALHIRAFSVSLIRGLHSETPSLITPGVKHLQCPALRALRHAVTPEKTAALLCFACGYTRCQAVC